MKDEIKDVFDTASLVPQSPISQEESEEVEKPPAMHDAKWTDYVLEQLEDDEMYSGKPTTDGLRRLVHKFLGDIVQSYPVVEQTPVIENDNRATVRWHLAIRWHGDTEDIRIFGEVADVYSGNSDPKFAVFATATAATKAEGRTYKKALQLRRVLTSEECYSAPEEEITHITKSQIAFIDTLCRPDRNDININKLLALSKIKGLNSINDVPHATAVKIIKYLSDCQRGIQPIPEPIKGYDENWRQNQ